MSLQPFKIVGKLVAIEKDDDGQIVGELPVCDMTVYAPRFGQLADEVARQWPAIIAQVEQARDEPGTV